MNKCWLYDKCNHCDCDKDFCIRKYKLNTLFTNALLENKKERQDLFVDSDNTDLTEFTKLAAIENNITAFIKDGKNLFLHSTICGNGKSSWAIRMVQSYFNEIWPESDLSCKALFVNVPRFLIALKDSISNTNTYADYIKTHVLEADIVIWDDIGNKVGTEYELNQLLSYIDSRLAANKSNIYTSNVKTADLNNVLGDRLASRVRLSTDIELHGTDKRGYFGGQN